MKAAAEKKRVLVFTLAPPLPATTGGNIYAINALAPFADEIDFHLFSFVGGQDDIATVARHREEYDRIFRSVHLEQRPPMPFQMSRLQRNVRLLWHALRGLPFIDASYCSRSAVVAARQVARRHAIDALEVNSSHLAFFRKFLGKPALLVSHNIESDIFPFWLAPGLTGAREKFMQWVARRSRRSARAVEIENRFGFAAMTFISVDDMQRVTANVPKLHMPLFFHKQVRPYAGKGTRPFRVLWMGGFGWPPNAEGVGWFIEAVYPLLRGELGRHGIELHFCGSHPPDALRALHDGRHVFVHGFVDDIDAMLGEAHLLMVPLLSGAGLRVKIVEAMSAGVPVLSTAKGCEGIGATDGQDILVRDDPAGFASAIVAASEDLPRMQGLALAGLRLIADRYSESLALTAKRRAYEWLGVL